LHYPPVTSINTFADGWGGFVNSWCLGRKTHLFKIISGTEKEHSADQKQSIPPLIFDFPVGWSSFSFRLLRYHRAGYRNETSSLSRRSTTDERCRRRHRRRHQACGIRSDV